jgi:hypothetical protein
MDAAAVLSTLPDNVSAAALPGATLPATRLLYVKVRAVSPCGQPGPLTE